MASSERSRAAVLVADDSEGARDLLHDLLSDEGYRVVCAADGQEALDLIRRENINLVLLDVMMPRRSGFSVCRAVKANPDTCLIPVVLITSLDSKEDRIQGIECGADDFLNKPVNKEELLARTRSLLRIKQFTSELEHAEKVLFSLALSIEAKDPYTEGHCSRLSAYSLALAKRLGLSEEQEIALRRGGIIHDIGKVAVPERILQKPGPLTAEEREIIEQHPVIGERICAPLKSFHAVLPIIRHHHERLDGSGYPDGLKGDAIPLTARILATVDIYDALTSDRCYRKALSREDAFRLMREEVKRGWWDGSLVDEFEALLEERSASQKELAMSKSRSESSHSGQSSAEEELDRFFRLSLDLLCVAGFDGYFKRLNPAWEATLGFTTQELLAKPFLDFVHPEDREAMIAVAQHLASGGAATSLRNRYLSKDGLYRWLSWKAIGVLEQEQIYATARDITEQRQAEEALLLAKREAERANESLRESEENIRSLLESAAEGIYGIDLEGKTTFCNPACLRLLGYSDSRDLLGKEMHALIHHSRPDGTPYPIEEYPIFAAHRRGDGAHIDDEVLWRADGTSFPAEYWVHPMRRRGQIVGSVVTFLDITERKLAEEANRKAKEAAERASKVKDQFLSTMSHELRTPLNAVLGFSELLKDERHGTLNDRQRRYINHVNLAGRHLLRLINDILDLSKIEAGRMELAIEDVRVQAAFNDVVETLRPLAEKKSQTLSHHAEPDLTVRADAVRLKQVLMNLTGNAIKFTSEGGKIELRARRENGRVRLEVQDNGPGISVEEQQHIFDAFTRPHQSDQVEGTGLGLAISRRLIELHEGSLDLESQPGQGSCFHITLPLAVSAPKEPARQAEPVDNRAHAPRVLVIEDDPAAALLIQAFLASSGYDVVVCNQSQRAAEMAAELQPQAITLDLLMKPTNGWDVLYQLKISPHTKDIPVVVVTIVNQPGQGAAFVADEYLVKPVEKPMLLAAIGRCLARRGISTPAHQPILVVEDNDAVREVLGEMLTAEGFAVVTAADGFEARNCVAACVPSLVILDLKLPGISGFELLAEWRANQRTADLPVFVLTGKDLTQEEKRYLRAHSESLIQKQSQWQEKLMNQLRRVLVLHPAG